MVRYLMSPLENRVGLGPNNQEEPDNLFKASQAHAETSHNVYYVKFYNTPASSARKIVHLTKVVNSKK